jgi:excisionase family DNA binding protein
MPDGRRIVWEKVGVADAAFYIGVSVRTIDRYCSDGVLRPSYTPGGHRRFSVAQLKKLRDQRRNPKRRNDQNHAKPRQVATP